MKRLIIILTSLLLLGGGKAAAWGWDHTLICYLAQEHVTPKTQEVLDRCESYVNLPADILALYNDLWIRLGVS